MKHPFTTIIKTFMGKTYEEMTDAELRQALLKCTSWSVDQVFSHGTDADKKECLSLSRQALSENKTLWVGRIYNNDADGGAEINGGRNFRIWIH